MNRMEQGLPYPVAEQLIAASAAKLRIAVERQESTRALAKYFKKVLGVCPELQNILAVQIDEERYVLCDGQVVTSIASIPPEQVITLEKRNEAEMKTSYLRDRNS